MIALPTLHLNGTAKDNLLEPLQEAIEAVRNATAAVISTYPNGRDYYPQGPEAIGKAMELHKSRLDRLHDVRSELEQMAEGIMDGGHKR